MRKSLLYIFIYIASVHLSVAQSNSFIFSNLNEEDGLSYNVVNCFLKDSRGILWIGTYNGFSRFDGSNFYNYKIRKGSNSLTSEVIHSLCEDSKGNIWGGSDNGVFCYIPSEDRFISYEIKSLNKAPNFYKIICDSKGDIWTAGLWSLFRLNREENKFYETVKLAGNNDAFDYFRISKNGFVEDPSGNGFWMSTTSGLVFYNKSTQSLTDSRTDPDNSLFRKGNISALCISPSGNIWFANNDLREVISFDPAKRTILQRIRLHDHLAEVRITTLFEDNNKRLWLSTWTYDVLVLNLAENITINRLTHNPEDRRSISSSFFWAAYQDADNTVWLGTMWGISRCNPDRNIYRQYELHEAIPELKNNQAIRFVEEDPEDKSLWITNSSSELINYNPADGRYAVFDLKKAEPAKSGARPGATNSIRFYKEYVIVSTYTGAWQMKKGTARIVPFDLLPAGYKDFICSEVLFSGDSAAYYNSGKELLYWNRLSGHAEILGFPPDSSIPADRTIISGLMETKDKRKWMISTGGYIAFLNAEKKLIRIKIGNEKMAGSGAISGIAEDNKGNIWISYKGFGLCRYNPSSKELLFWNEPDGLPGNRIHKLIIDKQDRVWAMIYNKVSVYNPATNKFYNFKIPYSESNYAYVNHMTQRSNGSLLGSINNEVFEFFTDRLFAAPVINKPQISQLTAPGKSIALFGGEKITLNPGENTLRFFFGSTIMKDFFPNDLEYKLDGAESDWTTAGDKHDALYNNLPSGDYTFRVRVKGKNNAWQSEEAAFRFTIKTPFVRSKLFFVLCGLLLAFTVLLFYRFRLNKQLQILTLETKAQQLEKEKTMVMYENLKQQLNPHFLFNSLTSLSGLIETNQQVAGKFLEQMSDIYRYILKNGDMETVLLKDELKFVQLYINLQKTRFGKGLLVNIDVPEEYHHFKIAPVTLQNMIENAIKHNIIDPESPLVIDIYTDDQDYIIIKNNLQKKSNVETSNKKGLLQFITLYGYLSSKPVVTNETAEYYSIKIPLV